MQFKLFSIPAAGDAEAEEELNRFLRSHWPFPSKRNWFKAATRRTGVFAWSIC